MDARQTRARSAPDPTTPTTWRRADVLAASLAINLLALALPLVTLQVYDRILPNQSVATLGVMVAALCVASLFDAFLNFAREALLARCGAHYEYHTHLAAMRAVLAADLAAFDADSRGVQLERFQAIEGLRDFHHGPSMLLAVELPFVLLFLGLIWQFSGVMVLIPLAMIAVFLALSWLAGRQLRASIAVRTDCLERRQNFIIECLQGIHTIKALSMEAQMLRRYERLQGHSATSIDDLVWVNAVIHGLAATFSQAVMVAFVAIGSVGVVDGSLTIGALAAGTMLAGRVLQPALRALSFWTHRQSIAEREQKLATLLALPAEARTGTRSPGRLSGRLELRGVHFSFPESPSPLLRDVNLLVEAGDSVSIRGPNGAGKSTLLNLIVGLVAPSEGRILFDDVDTAELDRRALRSQIALIPQQGVLISGNLLDNMTMGRTGEAVVDAMRLAGRLGLDAAIRRLPDGLDTRTSSDVSHSLTLGFSQRLVTVRALIGEPAIILFDDANTGLDDEGDQRLRDLLAELATRHTLIVVSHRPSLQRICSRHYELRDGHLLPVTGATVGPRQDPARLRLFRTLSRSA